MQQLTALHPRLTAITTNNPSPGTWDQGREGWKKIVAGNVWYHQTDIDLSGYALQDLTFFPEAVGIQDPGIYSLSTADSALTALRLQVLDIVTSVPLTEEQILGISDRQTGMIGPGMLGSKEDFETILMGQYRAFTYDNSLAAVPGSCILQRSQRFGSGEPNASDKLATYRIVSFYAEPNFPSPFTELDRLTIPAARFLINGSMVKEEDLVHMMRLKRSYELANQV